MRIAYMTGEFPRATDTFIQREVEALRDLGVHIETFSIRRPAAEERVVGEGGRLRDDTWYVLPAGPWKIINAHVRCLMRSPIRYVKGIWAALQSMPGELRPMLYQCFYFLEAPLVAERMQSRKLTHLHNHFADSSCSVAMLASIIGGHTFSFTLHGSAVFYAPERWRLDTKLRRALFTCCISHFCRSQAMLFSAHTKWKHFHVVHCAVDANSYSLRSHEAKGSRLAWVGRVAAVKGLPVLFDAVSRLRMRHPEVQLTLVGDGPDRAAMEALVREFGIERHVTFTGYCSREDIRTLLQEQDVFVLSSFAEGVPVVLMEAMASGLPVVATQVGGVSELVEEGVSGFLVRPGDVDSLEVRIDDLIDSPALRKRFGRAGRAMVEREFDSTREAIWLKQVFEDYQNGRIPPVRSTEQVNHRLPGEHTPQYQREAVRTDFSQLEQR